MHHPILTILLPVYNAENYIAETVYSILKQTFVDFELIIINDCSTDSTLHILEEISDRRIQLITNTENEGLISVLNKGMKLAKGKYIARIDADDVAYHDRMFHQISFLEKNEDYILVGSAAKEIDEKGTEGEIIRYHESSDDLHFLLCFYCPIIHPSVMFRSEVVKKYDLQFDLNYKHAEDYEFWTRLIQYGKFKNLDYPLIKYRIHQNQISSQHSEFQKKQVELIRKKFIVHVLAEYSSSEIAYLFFEKNDVSFRFKYFTLIKFIEDSRFQGGVKYRYLSKKMKELFIESTSLTLLDLKTIVFSIYFWKLNFTIKQRFSILHKSIRNFKI